LFDLLHFLNFTMAGLAVHATSNMSRVIEVNKVGKIVNLDPFNGGPFIVSFANFLDVGTVGFDSEMAIHAGAESGDVRSFRTLDLIVAVLALNFILANVQ